MRLAGALLLACLAGCQPTTGTPFKINFTLSPLAQESLKASGERVKFIADFYWRPASGGPSHDESEIGYVLGGWPLGEEKQEADWNTGSVEFAARIPDSPRMHAGEGKLRVLINVVSARRKGPDNILSCDWFDDEVAKAVAEGVGVRCELSSERF